MKATSPKEKSGGAANASRSESLSADILSFSDYRVNHVPAQWQKEAKRLWGEYRRTGNPSHLKAFQVHRAAMGGRLHGEATR